MPLADDLVVKRLLLRLGEARNAHPVGRVLRDQSTLLQEGEDVGQGVLLCELGDIAHESVARNASERVLDPGKRSANLLIMREIADDLEDLLGREVVVQTDVIKTSTLRGVVVVDFLFLHGDCEKGV